MNRDQLFYLFLFVIIGVVIYQCTNGNLLQNIPCLSRKQGFNQNTATPATSQEVSILYFFYAPWCHYCKEFKPEWEKIEKEFNNTTVKTVAINCDEEDGMTKSLMKKYNVEGFPTIVFQDEIYNGPRDFESLKNHVNNNK